MKRFGSSKPFQHVGSWRIVICTTPIRAVIVRGCPRLLAANILECGHRYELRGKRAMNGHTVVRRRCIVGSCDKRLWPVNAGEARGSIDCTSVAAQVVAQLAAHYAGRVTRPLEDSL